QKNPCASVKSVLIRVPKKIRVHPSNPSQSVSPKKSVCIRQIRLNPCPPKNPCPKTIPYSKSINPQNPLMLLLGIDIGTSSIKASMVNPTTRKIVASASFPETESEVIAPNPGWAEQSPDQWWEHVAQAILKCHATGTYNPMDIAAIGIAYQMHGLVLVDKDQHVLRNSIIWCDSRAVNLGDAAFEKIGEEKCLEHLLNSPGNFTASKLAWVKENEPAVYKKIHKIMLPGDYIAMKMTGESTTTVSALSEGIFWDFKLNRVSEDIMEYFGFDDSMLPE